jgi:hypothetical protein
MRSRDIPGVGGGCLPYTDKGPNSHTHSLFHPFSLKLLSSRVAGHLFPEEGMKDSYFIFINLCLLYRGLNSGPNLEPLYQTFFVMFFFRDRVSRTICPGWLPTS